MDLNDDARDVCFSLPRSGASLASDIMLMS